MADLEQQQQPTSVVPAAGEPYHQDNNSGTAPAAEGPSWTWIKTPTGILRIVEFLFAIISFATMADVSGFDEYSQFKYLVAIGVIVFLYTLTLVVVYIFRSAIERKCLYLPVIELAMDGIFVVLLLAAGAAAASRLSETLDGTEGQNILDGASSRNKSNLQASVVFTFFNMICFMVSAFFSYRANAAEEAKR